MNFRHAYLASLGFEHGKIAKSEIGALFVEEVVPLNQLRRSCLRVGVGVTWRGTTWKLLLNVIPPQNAAWELASETRENSYEDLLSAAKGVFRVGASREDRIMAAYAVYAVFLSRGMSPGRGYPVPQTLIDFQEHHEASRVRIVVRVMCRVFATEWEAFWCAVRFIQNQRTVAVLKRTGKQIQSWGVSYRVRLLLELLMLKDPDLARVLRKDGLNEDHFASLWFRTCFADVLREDNVLELWDHVIAAPADFIAHFALELLRFLKPRIMQLQADPKAVFHLLSHLPPLPNLSKFTEIAAASTATLLEKDHQDPLLTFDVEWPTVRFGSRGVSVKVLQLLLRSRGFGGMFSVDGTYGARTDAAITNWKRKLSKEQSDSRKMVLSRAQDQVAGVPSIEGGSEGLDAPSEGHSRSAHVIGADEAETGTPLGSTEDAYSVLRKPPSSAAFPLTTSASPSSASPSMATPISNWEEEKAVGARLWPTLIQPLSASSRGDAVRALQALLLHGHGYGNVREDGYFGTQTVNAVKDFQANGAARAMPVDGIVGPVTWIHLLAAVEQ